MDKQQGIWLRFLPSITPRQSDRGRNITILEEATASVRLARAPIMPVDKRKGGKENELGGRQFGEWRDGAPSI